MHTTFGRLGRIGPAVAAAALACGAPRSPEPASPAAAAGRGAEARRPLVKGHYDEVDVGSFDLVDGIAYAVNGGAKLHLVSKPIASSVLVATPCALAHVHSLELLRNGGYLDMTLDSRGRCRAFAAGQVMGGSLAGGSPRRSWDVSGGKVENGRVAGRASQAGHARLDFDIPLVTLPANDVRRTPSEEELRNAYAAVRRAALARDLKGLLETQAFDPPAIEAAAALPGIGADMAVFASRFLDPGSPEEPTLEPGMARIGARGRNPAGKPFVDYYTFEPCGDALVLVDIGENPQ